MTDSKLSQKPQDKPQDKPKDENPFEEHDKRYEPRRTRHRKPLAGSQMAETGEGSVVFPPGVTGRLVDDEGRELSVYERLALLEGDSPSYGHHV